MVASVATVDGVFRALSDPTRRDVIARLTRRPESVSALAEPFDMALPSLMQHLGVLESSGLIRSTKTGRVRTYRLVPKRLQVAEHWLAAQRDLWEHRMDQFESFANSMEGEQ
ncbi:MAG TPA: metalloregulator ArsR/SmtB family transcription factor [Acidimicrobiia bacterium]|jgi:DNA-binding transcriptional ArsR family regulator|nr:metalloregulator ArsR/SmtB family transcription factor [Acidimicrobiia bacterium]